MPFPSPAECGLPDPGQPSEQLRDFLKGWARVLESDDFQWFASECHAGVAEKGAAVCAALIQATSSAHRALTELKDEKELAWIVLECHQHAWAFLQLQKTDRELKFLETAPTVVAH